MSHTPEKHRCCETVIRGWDYLQCSRTGSLEHEGAWYCKQHHPPAVKAKDEERKAKSEATWNAYKTASAEAAREKSEIERKAGCYDELLAALKACKACVDDWIKASANSDCLAANAADFAAIRLAESAIARAEGKCE